MEKSYREAHLSILNQTNPTMAGLWYKEFLDSQRKIIYAITYNETITEEIIERIIEDSLDEKSFMCRAEGMADFYIRLLRIRFPAESILLPVDERAKEFKAFERKRKMKLATMFGMLSSTIKYN